MADHRPLLGRLVLAGDISSAYIDRSELGKAVVRCMAKMSEVFPQIRLLKYTVMESHVHFIIHVTEPLPVGIREVLRRFWRSCEKEGRVVGGEALERLLEVR